MGTPEIFRFPMHEIDNFDALYLLEMIQERVDPGVVDHALFAGFAIPKIALNGTYEPGMDGTYAVTMAEWRQALDDANTGFDPFFNGMRDIDTGRTFATVAAYEPSQLRETLEVDMNYFRTVDGRDLGGAAICLFAWDQ